MLDFSINALGRIAGIAAFACGLAAWLVLAAGFSYCYFFLPDSLPNPKSIMTPRTAGLLTVTAAAALLSCAGLSLSLLALIIGQNRAWAWMALGTAAAFWIVSGAIIYFHRRPIQ